MVKAGRKWLGVPARTCVVVQVGGESHPMPPSAPCAQVSCARPPQGGCSAQALVPQYNRLFYNRPVPVCPHGFCAQGPCTAMLWVRLGAWVLLRSLQPAGVGGGVCRGWGGCTRGAVQGLY